MSLVVVYGASDDLIEVDGHIREEFYANSDEEPNLLAFSDGTLLEVTYTNSGLWRINTLSQSAGTRITKVEALGDEGTTSDGYPRYSDRVTLEGFLVWVVFGSQWARAVQPVDA